MSKFVVIAGMYRSGSTWSYNVTRLMLERLVGADKVYARFHEEYNHEIANQPHMAYRIGKAHHWMAEWADAASCIIYSDRDYDEVIQSMNRMHTQVEDKYWEHPDFKEAMRGEQNAWKPRAHVYFAFNEIFNNKLGIALRIAETLGILTGKMREDGKLSFEEVLSVVREVEAIPNLPEDVPTYKYDESNLMHARHRSNRFDI